MTKLEAMQRELAQSGKMQTLRELAASEEGQRLGKMFDVKKLADAAKSGDAQALGDVLRQILGTPEGQRLAADVKKAMDR